MNKIKGIMFLYLDCGTLPLTKIDKFIEEIREKRFKKEIIERLKKQGVELVVLPCRSGLTRIEYMPC